MADNKNFNHVSHIKSKLTRDITPEEFYGLTPTADNSSNAGSSPIKLNLAKRPTSDKLIEGEIAVNFKKGHETLTIKNDAEEIVAFVNENDFNDAQEIIALGLAEEKDERMRDVARLDEKINGDIDSKIDELEDDVEERFNEFDSNVEDLELIISSALNDLNTRIISNEEKIQEVTTEIGDEIDVKLEGLTEDVNGLTEEVNGLSEEVNGLSEDVEEVQNDVEEIDLVVSSALNDLNTRIISNEDKIQELTTEIGDEIDVKLEGLTEEVNGLSEDVEEVQNDVQEIDLVVSSALNDLNTRIISNEEKIGELDGDVDEKFEEFEEEINGKIVDVKNYVINMELVISSALNDLNTRIIQIVNRLNQMNP